MMAVKNGEITPDLIEWLVADPEVATAWRSIALALDLREVVPALEVNRRTRRTDRHRLKELLGIWKTRKPLSYNVPSLLAILEAQGLKSMASWVRLMTDTKLEASELREYVHRRLQGPPLHCTVRSEGRLTPRPRSAMFYSAPASPHQHLLHQPSSSPWSSQPSPSPSPRASPSPRQRASPSPQREGKPERGGGVFATLYKPDQVGTRQTHSPQHRGNNAGDEGRRHSLVGEQASKPEHLRRHSLGPLVVTHRPTEGDHLPTILESPGFKPCQELHISESPSRPLKDLESALQALEKERKPMKDFDSALESYRGGVAGKSFAGSFDSRSCNSGNDWGNTQRPSSVIGVEEKYRKEKYFDKAHSFNKFDRFDKLDNPKNIGTGKYFDNLVAMIEGSMRGLDL